MKVDSVDFYYLSMPEVLDIGDGSQDVLLVRVTAGNWQGWGECEASPLVSIASLIAPMSHSACKPVAASVLGQDLNSPDDIATINRAVRANSFDQLQASHTLSGIDIALWDLLGHRHEEPVYRLLGYDRALPKQPYASVLFGDDPEQTYQRGRNAVHHGYRAVKFGWQGFGLGSLPGDVAQLEAAREGIGVDADLLVDAAMAWGSDPAPAVDRVAALEKFGVLFIEEPFVPGADAAYRELKKALSTVKIAGGEGCHTVEMAAGMMAHSGLDYIQVDAGRIGGITGARQVADLAAANKITYLNHTFTSHLALSASIQPYAGQPTSLMCEYPVESKPVSAELTVNQIRPDQNGMITVPEAPGLGLIINEETIMRYLVEVEITVNNNALYRTPRLEGPIERTTR